MTSNNQTTSKHMTDKQMISSDSDPSFQLNCEESYANYSIWAAVHGTAFISCCDYKNSRTILYPLCVRIFMVFPPLKGI